MCEHDINDRKPFEEISLFMLSQCRFGWMKLDTDDVSITYRIFINEEEHENCNPGIWLLKNKNTLRVNIGLETSYQDTCATTKASECVNVLQIESCDINNLSLIHI